MNVILALKQEDQIDLSRWSTVKNLTLWGKQSLLNKGKGRKAEKGRRGERGKRRKNVKKSERKMHVF